MDQFELFPGEPDSPVYEVEGFSAMPPDQQEQVRRYFRVNVAGQQMADMKDQMTFGGNEGLLGKADIVADEFVRNYTGGLGDYAGAAASYLTDALPGRSPMEGLGFTERRDALRSMRDIRSGLIPRWLDNTASLMGVLSVGTGPMSKPILGPGAAAAYGTAVGAGEALGTSEGQTAGEIATDTGVGAALGGATAFGMDILLDKALGGAARRAFAKREPGASAMAYGAQARLGIPPSVGSVGNDLAAMLENSMASSPVAPISAMLPGTSALERQAGQRQLLDTALNREVTGPMRPPGAVPAATDADLAYNAGELARNTSGRLDDEIDQMEGAYERLVPPQTPTNIQATRDFPDLLRRENSAESLARQADKDIDAINANPVSPVDPALHGQLMAQRATYQANIRNAQQQLQRLGDGGNNVQKANLNRTIASNEKKLADVDAKIFDNMGPAWKALRQERNQIGKGTTEGGLKGGQVAGRLYGTITDDLAQAADRIRPGAGDEFLAMTSREKDIYADKKILNRYEGGNTSANFPALRSAVLKGNWQDLDVLLSKATPDETAAFQADLIDMLGRPTGARNPNAFDAGQFAGNWAHMPDAAKQRLFAGNPDGLAVAETLAEVAKDFQARAGMANHTNTAGHSSVLAFLGATVAAPQKVVAFLSVTTGLDRAMVSDTLARAVAGQRTPLGDLMRKAATAYAGTGDENMEFGPQ